MHKPSFPSDSAAPIFSSLLGQPTGSTLQRGDLPQYAHVSRLKPVMTERAPTNALRESNRQATYILARQAGIHSWINTPYLLNVVSVVVLGVVASGFVYLLA